MVAFADQVATAQQGLARLHQVLDGRDLPRGVVHADLAALGRRRCVGPDPEETKVVMIVAAVGAQQDRLGAGHLDNGKPSRSL